MWSIEELDGLLKFGCVKTYTDLGLIPKGAVLIRGIDGWKQEIFKSWVVPVIPFLDSGNLEVLVKLIPQVESSIVSSWFKENSQNPLKLERSLERARLNSWLVDKALTQLFQTESLSRWLGKHINQLVNRLYLAFGLMSPFYHLETLVGDPWWLGDTDRVKPSPDAGRLDLISFYLPAALWESISATSGNWHGLNWRTIKEQTQSLLRKPVQQRILLNLARMTGIRPEHLVFAANALEWIPRRVGGKKSDTLTLAEALKQVSVMLLEPNPSPSTAADVLAQTNALIRFFNWVPLLETAENFEGKCWTYASVCDTAQELWELLCHNPKVWRGDFGHHFSRRLVPQLENVDATSAKGRFLLQLILEERQLKPKYDVRLDRNWQQRVIQAVAGYHEPVDEPTRHLYPRSLVGDKPFGLALIDKLVGTDYVAPGFSITTSHVARLLAEAKTVAPAWLMELIEDGVSRLPGVQQWAVRSSSLDEGQARGVYGTLLDVPTNQLARAILDCIGSFFADKAIAFRRAAKASNLPIFSVLVMPMYHDIGGTALTREQYTTVVEAGTSPAAMTSNWGDSVTAPQRTVDQVKSLAIEIFAVFGPHQIEWVKQGHWVVLLQVDFLGPTIPILKATRKGRRRPSQTIWISSADMGEKLANRLRWWPDDVDFVLALEADIDIEQFHGELLHLIVEWGERIRAVKVAGPFSSTSHFANICRYFGIALVGGNR